MGDAAGPVPGRPLDFAIQVHQNRHLALGERELNAILTIAAQRPGRPAGQQSVGGDAAEVIIVDCSSSMAIPEKLDAAIRAATVAIDTLRDGVLFAVVAGTHTASLVYPDTRELRPATARTRSEARRAVSRLFANGGTVMSTWLALARDLLEDHPSRIRHAVLLTDGQNAEPSSTLERVLRTCREVFTCDSRGIGDDWQPAELLRIADLLHGTADAVPDLAELPTDFQRVIRAAMGKAIPQLRVRITTGQFATLRSLEQFFPRQSDITDRITRLDERTSEVATGAWGEEVRDYHLRLTLDDRHRPRLEDLRAARIDLFVDTEPCIPPVPVLAHWTPDQSRSSMIESKFAGYSRQQEASRAMVAGLRAHASGQMADAEYHLGVAARLATEKSNSEVLARLRSIVEIVDPAAGVVKLRSSVARRSLHSVAMASRFSVLEPGRPRSQDATDRTCACGRVSPGTAIYCEQCGAELRGDVPHVLARRPA